MTDKITPQTFVWQNGAMVPLNGRLADRQFTVGEKYLLTVHEERSEASHRHYFAAVRTAWENLPEHLAERIPSPEALRKYALIKAGYYDVAEYVFGTDAGAHEFKRFVQAKDDYAVVTVSGGVATVYTAKSQSAKAMGSKRAFEESKQKVLDILAPFIGTDARTLEQNAA